MTVVHLKKERITTSDAEKEREGTTRKINRGIGTDVEQSLFLTLKFCASKCSAWDKELICACSALRLLSSVCR